MCVKLMMGKGPEGVQEYLAKYVYGQANLERLSGDERV